jgi:hypothetical protein
VKYFFNKIKRKEVFLQKELSALKRWLKKDGNSEADLASALGYKSSTTINMWIKRQRIPKHMRQRVMEIVGK